MRLGAALSLVVLACAACGGGSHTAVTVTRTLAARAPHPAGLAVGVVGPLHVEAQGIEPQRGTLAQVAGLPLVLVSAQVADAATVAQAAAAHPGSHFALVGASTKGEHEHNLVGIVLRDDEAATLAGVVAGLVASESGGSTPRVAYVGPEEQRLAVPFGRGVHQALPSAQVLHQWSKRAPARCKEAALTAIDRGAAIVMAHGGTCADAAEAAAHQQNLPALRLGDFELPSVAADLIAHDAAGGVYHGNEDIVFGAASGAIAIGSLDGRIALSTVLRARTVTAAG
jgi:basic membrane lipoprotein Med (substrate-binding protein (PBP1-ABC) superfamily)